MSEGPISQERRAHVAAAATTAVKDRVCMSGRGLNATLGRTYCGRRVTSKTPLTTEWTGVTCSECTAARHADREEGLL